MTHQIITLTELYIYDRSLFKIKNLKSFLKTHKVPEHDVSRLKGNKIGVTSAWVKKNLPQFKLNLLDPTSSTEPVFDVKTILEKYKCKNFNPILLNLDSSTVKYYLVSDERTPFFTKKGLIKIMVLFDQFDDNIYEWVSELWEGDLKTCVTNLSNVKEMVSADHPPIVKKDKKGNIYDISLDDTIIDFKHIHDYKMDNDLSKWKCPLFSQVLNLCQQKIRETETIYENQVKELKQDKMIQVLKQELDKEKSLKDQALSLTQSFVPHRFIASPEHHESPQIKTPILKPSKIK